MELPILLTAQTLAKAFIIATDVKAGVGGVCVCVCEISALYSNRRVSMADFYLGHNQPFFVGPRCIPQSFQNLSRKQQVGPSHRHALLPTSVTLLIMRRGGARMKLLVRPMLAPLREILLTQKPFFILSLCYLLFENLMNIKMNLNTIPKS